MKIYPKKNSLEDETVLMQLERRHTLKEDLNDSNPENNVRKTTRANSLCSFQEGQPSTDIEAVSEKRSNFKRRPTVITESELSSSTLYKDRKAKINSDDESVEDPLPNLPSENPEDLEPRVLHDPNLKPIPVTNQRHRKMSSCCWYFMIISVIGIACLAVMSGVGGIVYMEYFAKLDMADNDTILESAMHPSDSKEKFRLDNLLPNESKTQENISKNIIQNSTNTASDTDVSKKVTISQPNEDDFRDKDPNESNKRNEKELNRAHSSFVYENRDVKVTEHPQVSEHAVISRNSQGKIKLFNNPKSDNSLDIKTNAKNKDSLGLNLDFQSKDTMDEVTKGQTVKVNKQMSRNRNDINEKSKSEVDVLDTKEDTLVAGRHFNFNEMPSLQGIKLNFEQLYEGKHFQDLPIENHIEHSDHHLSNSNFLDQMEKSINNNENTFFGLGRHFIDHDSIDNSMDHTESLIDHTSQHSFIDLGFKDHLIDNGFKDNLIDHNDEDNLVHHGNKDNLLHHGTKDNLIDHGFKDHLIDNGFKGNLIKHDLEDNFVHHGTKDNLIDHDPKDNLIDHGPRDNLIGHGPGDNLIDKGPKISLIDHGSKDSLIDHGSKDGLVDNGPKISLIDHGSKDRLIDHGPKDSLIYHGPKDGLIDNVSKDSLIVDGVKDSSIDSGPKDSLTDSGPKDSLIDSGSKDNLTGHGPTNNLTDHGPTNNLTDHGPTNNLTDHGPKDDLIDNGPINLLNHAKHSIDTSDKSLNVQNKDSSDFDERLFKENSLANVQNQNSNDSSQLVFIRPVVESKAVPVPLAFLRRIGFDIKNANGHQPMTAKDMDIKFSLAEALKYLRSLDTDNNLPTSREKTKIHINTSNLEDNKKMKFPVASKRQELRTTNNLIDHVPTNNLIELDPKDDLIDNDPKNSLNHAKHSIDPNVKSLNVQNKNSGDFDFEESPSKENSLANNQNQNSDNSSQLVFIRSEVESKAVPVPLVFLQRIGLDIKNANSHQPMTTKDMDIKFSLADALKYLRSLDRDKNLPTSREKTKIRNKTSTQEDKKKTKLPIKNANSLQSMIAKDMDIKFSLAEALKYLRSLDTGNKLPTSREKTKIRNKTSNQEDNKKTELPVASEGQEYLNILRKKMFENSS